MKAVWNSTVVADSDDTVVVEGQRQGGAVRGLRHPHHLPVEG
jgi:hypothetical protein